MVLGLVHKVIPSPSLFSPREVPSTSQPSKDSSPPKAQGNLPTAGQSKSSPEFRRQCYAKERGLSRSLVPAPPRAGGEGSWEGHFCLLEHHFLICQTLSVEMHRVFWWGSQGHKAMGGCSVRRGWEDRNPRLAQPVPLPCDFGRVTSPPWIQNLSVLRMWKLKTLSALLELWTL